MATLYGRIDDLPKEWIPDALAFVQGRIDALPKALPPAEESGPDSQYLGRFFAEYEKDALILEETIGALCTKFALFGHPTGVLPSTASRNEVLLSAISSNAAAAKNAMGTGHFLMQTVRRLCAAIK